VLHRRKKDARPHRRTNARPHRRTNARPHGRTDANARGFTLLEMIVVVAVIGTLAAIVGPALFRNVGDANTSAARSQIEMLGLALESYRLDNLAYPTTDQGLEALAKLPTEQPTPPKWRGPYLRRALPSDPWGQPYAYESPASRSGQGFDLYTLGRDGEIGGEDEDADITSWGAPLEEAGS